MNYETWRITYQSSEQAAQAAFEELQRLAAARDKLQERLDDAIRVNRLYLYNASPEVTKEVTKQGAVGMKGECPNRGVTTVNAIALVIAERNRQIKTEGWTPEHDDQYADGELASAAACYANQGRYAYPTPGEPGPNWPWAPEWWKPSDYRRNLVKAAALIVAELERLERATEQGGT